MFLKLLELRGAADYYLDNEGSTAEANFYRRRRNHLKRDANNLDGRIKPSFIRIMIDDENAPIDPKVLEYAKKHRIDIIVIDKSKYRKEETINKDEQER